MKRFEAFWPKRIYKVTRFGRNASRWLILFVMLTTFIPNVAMSADINGKIEAQRRKVEATQSALAQKRAELHAATVRVSNLQDALHQTQSAMDSVQGRLDAVRDQETNTQRKLAWNTLQLNAARASLALHDEALKRRLVDTYERGDLGYISVLLAAKSFSDFVERWEDLRLLVAANQKAVRTRKVAEQKVSSAQSALLATQSALQQEELTRQRALNQLGILVQEKQNIVALADARRRHVASDVAQMEGLSQSEESALEELIREKEAQIAAARRASGISGPEFSTPPGLVAWPVHGTITSPFGWRQNPFGGGPEFHQGLDIAASTGTTVTAAASGTVISAGWYGGYGNYILIDHGGGMSTGYGHLSQIFVASGQTVQKGQAIGAVGSTGASTGPHLHFEVRMHGKPVDPAAYLK